MSPELINAIKCKNVNNVKDIIEKLNVFSLGLILLRMILLLNE